MSVNSTTNNYILMFMMSGFCGLNIASATICKSIYDKL